MAAIRQDQRILTLVHTPVEGSTIFFHPERIHPGGPISQKEMDTIIARYNQLFEEYVKGGVNAMNKACLLPLSLCCFCCCAPCLVGKSIAEEVSQLQINFNSNLNTLTTVINEELAPRGLFCQLRTEAVGKFDSEDYGMRIGSSAFNSHRLEIYYNADYVTRPTAYPQSQPAMTLFNK